MWICLTDGFLSIVEDLYTSGKLLVRARDEQTISNVFGLNYSTQRVLHKLIQ
jgi:hypothetical protein